MRSYLYRHKRLPTLALVAAIAAIAGCGSSSTSSSVATSAPAATTVTQVNSTAPAQALSSEQFTLRANAICQRLNVQLAASKDNVRRRSDYARVSPQRAAMISASVAEMRKLPPPPPPAASYWSKVLSDRQALAGYANHVGLAASTNDQAALKADLAASTGVVLDLPSAAAGAGVTECAHVGGPT